MATTDYLADPADLAAWMGVPATDPKLVRALAAASSRFRGAVRHHVSAVVDDETVLDGNGRSALLLPATPVTAVKELLLDGVALVDGDDFEWSSADGRLRRLCGVWPDRLRCLRIVWDHGFTVVPEDIAEVVIDQARAQYAVLPGVQTRQVGGQSVTFGATASTGVTTQWTTVVERYRLNAGDRA